MTCPINWGKSTLANWRKGLQFLVALWVLRDIRFIILPTTITDAKRKLTQERRASRLNAFREFTSALQLVS